MKNLIKISEQDLHNIIKEVFEKINNGYMENDSSIKIYHRAGMHTRLSLKEVIRSICKNGLTTSTATDGDGIGNCVWFTTDFNSYGKNGLFVVSMELTKDNAEKYRINYNDFPNVYAYRDIPFSELKIEKMPMFYTTLGGGSFLTNMQKPKNANNYFDFFVKSVLSHKQFEFIMYKDAWDYYGEPYDLKTIESINNIKIGKIMS
jgi:uncharacterized protein (UPF0248 family)